MNQLFGAFCHSALHTAARFSREDLAAFLITRGGNINVGTDPNGETPLHLAANGHAPVAAVLVSRGADVNAADHVRTTPLHDAAFGQAGTSDVDGRVEVAKLLISRGANVNARERGRAAYAARPDDRHGESRAPRDAARGGGSHSGPIGSSASEDPS